MMRLPARLGAEIVKARISQFFGATPALSPVQVFDAADVLHPGAAAPVSLQNMERLIKNPAAVIWIRGTEPLAHPGIGHFVRAITQSGQFVFLETSGTLLRRRIHEFQPQARLFLTVRVESLPSPDRQLAVEGLRAAHLSGFFSVVLSEVDADQDLAQLFALPSLLSELNVDGLLITSGSTDPASVRKAAEARGLIPSWFWRRFSLLVEQEVVARTQSPGSRDASPAEAPHARECGESIRVA